MAFVKSEKSQNELLVRFLRGKNRTISAPQAEALFGIKNLSARMSELRQAGYRVRVVENTEGKTAYKIPRRMVWQKD
jgi:hypothetical protein